MGFVSKIAPPSTSSVCVHSGLAAVPARQGVQRTGHAIVSACACSIASASLLAFGPGLPLRGSFRPCRFSRLRRFSPHTRCRSVAPCSRSWGSPGCRQHLDPASAPSTRCVRPLRAAPPCWTAPRGPSGPIRRSVPGPRATRPTLHAEARRASEPGDRAALHRWSDGRMSTTTATGRGWSWSPADEPRSVVGLAGCWLTGRAVVQVALVVNVRRAANPPFAVCRAEALRREVGADCRSTQTPAPFPQARSPFEAFPSSTAVPRHRGRCPLDVSGAGRSPSSLLPASLVACPSSRVLRALIHGRVRCAASA